MTLMDHLLLTTKTAEVKSFYTSLISEQTGYALHEEICTRMLTESPQRYDTSLTFGRLSKGRVEGAVTINDLYFAEATMVNADHLGNRLLYGRLVMSAYSNVPIYGPRYFSLRPISWIYVTVDSKGMIVACGNHLNPSPRIEADFDHECSRGCSETGGTMSNGTCLYNSRQH